MRCGRRNQTELRALLESTQLRRQMNLLHHAISSGALNLQHFGLQSKVCVVSGAVEHQPVDVRLGCH